MKISQVLLGFLTRCTLINPCRITIILNSWKVYHLLWQTLQEFIIILILQGFMRVQRIKNYKRVIEIFIYARRIYETFMYSKTVCESEMYLCW